MKAIVLAYNDIGCIGIEAVLASGIEIAAVFTHADDPKETLWFQSVAELAARKGIPVYAPDDINHPLWIDRIRALEPDILFSFYYRKLIGGELLAIPPQGCLNLHGSLLPRYRGCAPANWAIVNGETETGVTLHYMTERADAGDIVAQGKVTIDPEDSGFTLNRKLAAAAGPLLAETLPLIRDGKASRRPQDDNQASYFGRRRPEDGRIDWQQSATDIHNLVRAVRKPYPGALTSFNSQEVVVWESEVVPASGDAPPGTVLSADPLEIRCGKNALRVRFAQPSGGVYTDGSQLAKELAIVRGARFGARGERRSPKRKQRVLILGVNGFIGNALTERLLQDGNYEVHGMDLNDTAIARFENHKDFFFHEGDISIHSEWIEYHIKKCDIILPLVAIATPIEYTRNPLRVFELDFEENLRIVRYCVKYGKRIVFPSTSEVYGMCEDPEFDEDESNLILGPIRKQRWIYSACKQLLDRVIWAYGKQQGLKFTLFRPFNWIGPRLDTLESARIGSSRAITQLILNLVEGAPLLLVDGGRQKRCFTDVAEGIECLFRIIENVDGKCDGKIFNIGNPANEASIKTLAETLIDRFQAHPLRHHFPPVAGIKLIESQRYYGEGYQDVVHRIPSISNAKQTLGWEPVIPLERSVERTLDFFLREHLDLQQDGSPALVAQADRTPRRREVALGAVGT